MTILKFALSMLSMVSCSMSIVSHDKFVNTKNETCDFFIDNIDGVGTVPFTQEFKELIKMKAGKTIANGKFIQEKLEEIMISAVKRRIYAGEY